MSDDTMVERVARALAVSAGSRITGPGRNAATDEFRWEGDGGHLDRYVSAHWKEHVHAATFAIEAMREPNRTMRVAAGEALYLPIEEARRLAEEEKFDEFANDGVIAWLSMIDAALK